MPILLRSLSAPKLIERAVLLTLLICSPVDAEGSRFLNFTRFPASAIVRHHPDLDASAARALLVSFRVRFLELPDADQRVYLLSKMDRDRSPPPGWGIGLHRYDTSLRPNLYWRGPNGKGGWIPFDDFRFLRNRWYCLTLVARSGEYALIFLEDPQEGEVRSLGGMDLNGLQPASSPADLVLGESRTSRYRFRGHLADLLVAHPEHLPQNAEDMRDYVRGCSAAVGERLSPSEIVTSGGQAVQLAELASWDSGP